jgi:hypothetical protein
MSDFVLPLLISICSGSIGTYNVACNKSVEASYQQSGYASQVNKFQDGAMSFGKYQEKQLFGSTTATINTVVAAGVIVKNKKATFILPNLGFCDRMSTDLQPEMVNLRLEWHW